MTAPHPYELETPEQRATRRARRLPQLETIRLDVISRRAGMSRVMHAEKHDPTTGWTDAARSEYNAQAMRHSAAEHAAEILAELEDMGGIGTFHERQLWARVALRALEISAAAAAVAADAPYYMAACDNIPDCPTPYAHILAHAPADA